MRFAQSCHLHVLVNAQLIHVDPVVVVNCRGSFVLGLNSLWLRNLYEDLVGWSLPLVELAEMFALDLLALTEAADNEKSPVGSLRS